MTNSLWIRIVSRTVFALNILVLAVLFLQPVLGLKELLSESARFPLAEVVSLLLLWFFGLLTGLLCAWTKKPFLRIVLVLVCFFILRAFSPPVAEDHIPWLLQGITTFCLTSWVPAIFSKGHSRFTKQAIVLAAGYAIAIFSFCVFYAPVVLLVSTFAGIHGANIVALCLVDEGNKPLSEDDNSAP